MNLSKVGLRNIRLKRDREIAKCVSKRSPLMSLTYDIHLFQDTFTYHINFRNKLVLFKFITRQKDFHKLLFLTAKFLFQVQGESKKYTYKGNHWNRS